MTKLQPTSTRATTPLPEPQRTPSDAPPAPRRPDAFERTPSAPGALLKRLGLEQAEQAGQAQDKRVEKRFASNVRALVSGLFERQKRAVEHTFSALRSFGLAALACTTLEDVKQLKDFATLAIQNGRPGEVFGILKDVADFVARYPDEARKVIAFIERAEKDTWKQKSAWMAPVSHVVQDPKRPAKHADVVVIGGGLAGGSVARSFAHAFEHGAAPKKVLVIERDKKESRAHAASLRNAGIVCTALDYVFELDEAVGEKPIQRIAGALKISRPEAEKVYRTMMEILRDAAKRIRTLVPGDVDLEPHGFLDIARTEDELADLQRAVAVAREQGLDWHVIDAAILGEKYGIEREGKIAGAVEFRDSAELHPGKLVKALFDYATGASKDVDVQYDTELRSARPDPKGEGWILETSQGTIHAKEVVDAREAFAPYPFRHARFSQVHVIDIGEHSQPAALGDTSVCHSLTYMRSLGAGKFLVGSGDFALDGSKDPPRPMASVALYAAAHFKKLFPDTPYDIERVWGGVFGSSPDELPVAGELLRGWHVIGGSGGSGLSLTPVLGEQVASAILGADGPMKPAEHFSPRRFFLLELREELARRLGVPVEEVRVEVGEGGPSKPAEHSFRVDAATLDAMNTDAAVLFGEDGPKEAKRRERAKHTWVEAQVLAARKSAQKTA